MILELYEALSPARAAVREEHVSGEANSERVTEEQKFENGKAKTEEVDPKMDVPRRNTPGSDSAGAAGSDAAWAYLRNLIEQEIRDLAEECRLQNEEYLETSAAMLDSWLGPRPETEKAWTLYVRMESSIERQIDRKLRLLMKLREEFPAPGRVDGCDRQPASRAGSRAGAEQRRRVSALPGRTMTRLHTRRAPLAVTGKEAGREAIRRRTRKMQEQSPQVIETAGRHASSATAPREMESSALRRGFAAGASHRGGAPRVRPAAETSVRAPSSSIRASRDCSATVAGAAHRKVLSRGPGKIPDPC
jgi:hypothetical protein